MQLKGILEIIEETTMVSETFKRRNFVVVTQNSEERMEYLRFELHQRHCSLLDNFVVGDKVLISFNIQGNKWMAGDGTFKFFNTLKAWKIEKILDHK